MANHNNLARPYANALFEIAKKNATIDVWSNYLKTLALAGSDSNFKRMVLNPRLASSAIVELLMQLLDNPPTQSRLFLELLRANNRLTVLPEIYELFELRVSLERNTASAVIKSAFAMSDTERCKFEAILSKKFKQQITATVEVAPELIGGVKILVNDVVIDASVQGGLEKMATKIMR